MADPDVERRASQRLPDGAVAAWTLYFVVVVAAASPQVPRQCLVYRLGQQSSIRGVFSVLVFFSVILSAHITAL